jgi:signal transduction histidine kinase
VAISRHPRGGQPLIATDDDAWITGGSLALVRLLSRISERYRRADPLRADAFTALITIGVWAVEVFVLDSPGGASRVLTFAVGAVAFSALALRRTNPLGATFWFVVVSLAQSPLDTFYLDTATLPFVVLIWIAYSLGRHLAGRRLLIGGLVLYLGFELSLVLTEFEVGSIPFGALFAFGPLVVGRGLANRAQLQAELRSKASEAAEQSRAEAERAVELERSRIATELQAVVANGISAMVVQAEAVPAMVAGVNGSSDRAGAGAALAVIEETGRDTLAEMRRLLGVLRHAGDGPLLAPQPSLDRVGSLIDASHQRGLEVTLEIEGARSELAGGVELSAFRTIETALQAAADSGAANAAVTVTYGDREVGVEVTDDRPENAPSDDAELASLRSRLDIYGGRLAADRHEGRFSVRVRLPNELA